MRWLLGGKPHSERGLDREVPHRNAGSSSRLRRSQPVALGHQPEASAVVRPTTLWRRTDTAHG